MNRLSHRTITALAWWADRTCPTNGKMVLEYEASVTRLSYSAAENTKGTRTQRHVNLRVTVNIFTQRSVWWKQDSGEDDHEQIWLGTTGEEMENCELPVFKTFLRPFSEFVLCFKMVWADKVENALSFCYQLIAFAPPTVPLKGASCHSNPGKLRWCTIFLVGSSQGTKREKTLRWDLRTSDRVETRRWRWRVSISSYSPISCTAWRILAPTLHIPWESRSSPSFQAVDVINT